MKLLGYNTEPEASPASASPKAKVCEDDLLVLQKMGEEGFGLPHGIREFQSVASDKAPGGRGRI